MALNKKFRKLWKIVNYFKAIFQNFLGSIEEICEKSQTL
jgi:hypothetical protein